MQGVDWAGIDLTGRAGGWDRTGTGRQADP